MRLRENSRSANAAATFLPRMSCATRLSFCGLTRSMRATAFASFSGRSRSRFFLPMFASSTLRAAAGRTRAGGGGTGGTLGLAIRRVTVERPRRRELPELVTDHLLGHQHRNMLLPVVDAEGQPDELRQDGRASAPDPDHFVPARRARCLRLLEQIAVDEWTLPNRTRHDEVPAYFFFRAWRLEMMNLVVDLFLRVFLPLVGKPHGVTGWRPPEVRPSPPPCGWSIGFIVTPRLCGMRPFQRWRPALPIEMFILSGFDTAPMVAMQRPCTKRCSAELSRRITYSPSRPTIWA